MTRGLSATSLQKKAKWETQPGLGPPVALELPWVHAATNKPKGPVLGAPGYSTIGKSPHEALVGPVFSFTIHRLRATTLFPHSKHPALAGLLLFSG